MAEQLSSRLKNRVEIWGLADTKNALGERDSKEVLLANVWCDIVPMSGKVKDIPDERPIFAPVFSRAATYGIITHEIVFRRSAMKYLNAKYRIRCGDAIFDIQYVMPHYNSPDRVVAYCNEKMVR